jgi:hypothetical protein
MYTFKFLEVVHIVAHFTNSFVFRQALQEPLLVMAVCWVSIIIFNVLQLVMVLKEGARKY